MYDKPAGRMAAWRNALAWSAIRFARRALRKHSPVGDRAFFDRAQFPAVISVLESNWKEIRKELDSLLIRAEDLPDFHDLTPSLPRLAAGKDWRAFSFLAYGNRSERNCRLCPRTAEVLGKVPGLKLAFFSILAPGTYLPPHEGVHPGVLRVHLGLRVPADAEKCWIRVGSTVRTWEEGKCMVFDDSYDHEVHNGTPEMRVVLFIDIMRPLAFPWSLLNAFATFLFSKTGLLREGRDKLDAWEKEFYGKERAVAAGAPALIP